MEAGAALVESLAEYVSGLDGPGPAAERDKLLLHVFDTLGVMAAGLRTEEAAAARAAAARAAMGVGAERGAAGGPQGGLLTLPGADLALVLAVATRMTEADDIDLGSCTTPGSVAVTTALALAAAGGRDGGARDFLAAVRCGYEVVTGLGALVDGPRVLATGVWPTCLCAAAGAAAVAARLWGLSRGQAADALGTALAMAHGLGVRSRGGLSARWLLLGAAVRGGVLAAAGAAAGFGVDGASAVRALPLAGGAGAEGSGGAGAGAAGAPRRLGTGLPAVGMKPFVTARQALAAVEGFTAALGEGGIRPADVRDVEIAVPEPYRAMVARPPAGGRESVASAAYRCALAALHPEDLYDVARIGYRDDAATRALVDRVRVVSAPDLTALYPRRWPARVRVAAAAGATREALVLSPRGDPEQPLGWDGVAAKLKALRPALDGVGLDGLRAGVRGLGRPAAGGADGALAGLLDAVGRLVAG